MHRFSVFILFIAVQLSTTAQNVVIDNNYQQQSLEKYTYFLPDSVGSLTFDQVQLYDSAFVSFSARSSVENYKSYWLRVNIENKLEQDVEMMFLAGLCKDIVLYYPTASGNYRQYNIGNNIAIDSVIALSDRAKVLSSKIKLLLPTGKVQKIYIQFISTAQKFIERDVLLAPEMATITAWNNAMISDYIAKYIFIGCYIIMLLFNIMYFILSRDKAYLFYSLYIVTIGVSITSFSIYLFGERWIEEVAFAFLFGLYPVFYFLFMLRTIDADKLIPRWKKRLRRWIKIKILIVVSYTVLLLIFSDFRVVEIPMTLSALIELIMMIIVMVLLIRQKDMVAKLFVMASLFSWLGFVAAAVTTDRAALVFGRSSNQSVNLGFVGQLALFSLTLSYRARKNEQEKQQAQQALILQLEENRLLQDKVNRELEAKVNERTLELRQAYDKIQETNEELHQTNEELHTSIELIQVQKETIEEAHEQITDSINYAGRIQKAALPQDELWNVLLPQHFILFSPRNVVSGDFYFLAHAEQYIIVAAADCTGHGVPGAFMSMLGINMLNNLIREQQSENCHHNHWACENCSRENPYCPAAILNKLRDEIKKSLHQTGNFGDSQDGMDISLCVIDTRKNRLQFAGAHNNLVMVRNNQLEEYKADNMPVGVYKIEKSFTRHDIELQKNDMIYMFSDGYADQIGGENRRKFMKRFFKDFLLEISDLEMVAQKNKLKNKFDDWRGNLPQVDDVLVIGIKI